jgi:hypothetical protein
LSINTYSPSDVDFLIDGYKITGWESISIKRDRDSYTFVSGIRGKNTRVRNYDKAAIITIDVLQTSETHDVLNQIHSKDVADGGSADVSTADNARLIVTIKDRSGTSALQSEDAYITGYPEMKFSQDFETRTWVIKCLTTSIFKCGGNLRPSTSLVDSIFSKVF